jgi:hypothetical protein
MDIPIEKKRSMQALPDDKRWVLLLQSRGTGLLVRTLPPARSGSVRWMTVARVGLTVTVMSWRVV